MPSVCARHGRPAATRRTMTVTQATPAWLYVLLPLGIIVFVIAREMYLTSSRARDWPFCDRCVSRRRAMLGTLAGGLALGLILFAIGLTTESAAAILVALAVALAVLIAYYVAGAWSDIAGARLGAHSGWLEVPRADEAFTRELASVPARAPVAAPVYSPPAAPVMKKLNPLWYIGLVGGILLVFLGGMALAGGPSCESPGDMRPGDICEATSRSGTTTTRTYDEEAATGWIQIAGGAIGAVVVVVCAIRIRRYSIALRRAIFPS